MTVKDLVKLLQGSTKNPNAEVIFKASVNGRIAITSASMCRYCEPELILHVPIEN